MKAASSCTSTVGSASAASDYAVTIDDCRMTEDYEGNPAAVVTFTLQIAMDERRRKTLVQLVDAARLQKPVGLPQGQSQREAHR